MVNFSKSDNSLTGSVAIVTGGSRGIGFAIANALADEGCKIVVCSRTSTEVKKAEKVLSEKTEVLGIVADVSNTGDCKRVMEETFKKFRKMDILINNAGISVYKTLEKTTEEEIDSILDTNLKGMIHLTRIALPHIKKGSFGRIVNISSGLGKSGMAGFTAYCATKFGVIGFTEALAGELEGNVKVHAVCPKRTDTKMYAHRFPGAGGKGLDSPEDVARVVMEILNPNSRIPSGSAIGV